MPIFVRLSTTFCTLLAIMGYLQAVDQAAARTIPRSKSGEHQTGVRACASYQGKRVYAWLDPAETQAEVLVFRESAGTNATPICQFTSPAMKGPGAGWISTDSIGQLWYMNNGYGTQASLMVFPKGANGTVQPSQTIAGKRTLLVPAPTQTAQEFAFASDGSVWVPDWWDYNGAYGYVTAYNSSADGDAPPIATIGYGDKGVSEHIIAPVAVTLDHSGNLYVIEEENPSQIAIFSPPFSDTEKPAAVWTLPYDGAQSICVDAKNNVYVGDAASIYVFHGGYPQSDGIPDKTLDLAPIGGMFSLACDPSGLVVAPLRYHPPYRSALAVLRPSGKGLTKVRYISSPAFEDLSSMASFGG